MAGRPPLKRKMGKDPYVPEDLELQIVKRILPL